MFNVKAIETEYKGFRFRSRLEARYAVFFDALKLEWEYEKEGFELPNGKRYLPDFYLPAFDCWWEVKGDYPTRDEIQKLMQLSAGTNRRSYLAYGSMGPAYFGNSDNYIEIGPNGSLDTGYWFCQCPYCGMLGITFNGRADRLPCHASFGCPVSAHGDKGYNFETELIINAYAAGKSARFEWGEHGALSHRLNHELS